MNNTTKLIYKLVSKIPKGKVMTYGQIAKILNIKSPRSVGKALHQNKDPKNIPCHRVVFADGSLSKNYAFGGEKKQKEKLKKEEVSFMSSKVDLAHHLFDFKNNTKSSF